MTGATYARDRIESVLLRAKMPDSYRIMPRRYRASPLGTIPADSRFCSRNAGYTVLYAAPDFATAFIETVVRDRFMRQRREREITLAEIADRIWARFSTLPGTVLTLLDLRGDGCAQLGVPTDAVHARNHMAGRAFAKAVHAENADIDGLVHISRLTGEDIYAVFDRGMGKLGSAETGTLMAHPDLPNVLGRCGIGLVP